jgi:uncharacterized protein (TIGR03000 family)
MRISFGIALTFGIAALPALQAQDSCGQASCAVPADVCGTCGEVSACCSGISGCGGCMNGMCFGGCMGCEVPPACGICGTACCWDCSHEEGIDVDSLTPAAQSKKLYEASLARIKFEVPEDAGVFLLDQRMSALGEKRVFVVPVESKDTKYKYEVKVDVVRGGKKYFKKHKITDLQAGMILVVKVAAPPVPDGEPAQIVLEAAPEHPGGKPADDGEGDDAGMNDDAGEGAAAEGAAGGDNGAAPAAE